MSVAPNEIRFATSKQQRVADALKALLARENEPGGQLPGERELARRLGVSRHTLRTVLGGFERQGEIRTLPFRGRQARLAPEPTAAQIVASGPTALSDTIVFLGDVSSNIVRPEGDAGGFTCFIEYAAFSAMRQTRFDTLVLQLNRLNPRRLDGLIAQRPAGVMIFREFFLLPHGRDLIDRLKRRGIPVVVQGQDPSLVDCDMVGSDHDAGAYQLTRFLIERGHKRILRFFPLPSDMKKIPPWLEIRSQAMERALVEAGLEVLPMVCYPSSNVSSDMFCREQFDHEARLSAGYLMDWLMGETKIDAIMAASDGPVFSIAAACRRLGKEPGRDLVIAGYDNYWKDCPTRRMDPYIPVATMDKDNGRIGQELLTLLLDRIEGKLPSAPQRRLIPARLVVNP